MDTFKSIVKKLKQQAGLELGFAAYAGADSPIGILADKNKSGQSLEAQAKKKGTLLASGSVSVSEDGKTCNFSCGTLKSGFKASALKPYLSEWKLAPVVAAAKAGALNPDSDDDAVDVEEEPLDETLITLWSKNFEKSLIANGVDAQVLAQFSGIDEPVTLKLPKYFLIALKANNAEAFAARIQDSVNTAYDAECVRIKRQIETWQQNPDLSLSLKDNFIGFADKSEKIVETAWDAFVKRYEVTKGFKKKRFKAVAIPFIGGVAAVTGTVASFTTGNVVGGVAGTVAALRASVALLTVWRQYVQDLEKILTRMEGAVNRLVRTYEAEKTAISDHARETGLVILNAVSGGGLAKSFKSIKDTVDVFIPRLALAERNLDAMMKEANTAIAKNISEIAPVRKEKKELEGRARTGGPDVRRKLDAANKTIDSSDKIAKEVTDLLDKIADDNALFRDMGVRVGKLNAIIAKLNAGTAMTMEQVEKVMTFLVNFVSAEANMSIGVATAGVALDVVLTTVGGLADTHDMLAAEFDALEVTFG